MLNLGGAEDRRKVREAERMHTQELVLRKAAEEQRVAVQVLRGPEEPMVHQRKWLGMKIQT